MQEEKCSALLCFHEAFLLMAGCLHLGVRRMVAVIAELHGRPTMWPSLWAGNKEPSEDVSSHSGPKPAGNWKLSPENNVIVVNRSEKEEMICALKGFVTMHPLSLS